MGRLQALWTDKRGVSKAIAVGLMVGVALVLFGTIGAFLFGVTGEVNEEPAVVNMESEVAGDEVIVHHASGDSLDPSELTVEVISGNNATVFNETLDGDRFSAGDTWNGSVPFSGEATVQVVHQPTNTVLHESGVEVNGTGTGSGPDPLVFYDDFDYSDYSFSATSGVTDVWELTEADDETIEVQNQDVLYHNSPFAYNNGGNMLTTESFESSGVKTVGARIKKVGSDYYWGYGLRLDFDNGAINVKEHKWGFNNDLKSQSSWGNVDLASPSSSNEWLNYSITIDFETGDVLKVRRGDETFEPDLTINPDSEFQVEIGNGRGHDVKYDSVWVYEGNMTDEPQPDS